MAQETLTEIHLVTGDTLVVMGDATGILGELTPGQQHPHGLAQFHRQNDTDVFVRPEHVTYVADIYMPTIEEMPTFLQ